MGGGGRGRRQSWEGQRWEWAAVGEVSRGRDRPWEGLRDQKGVFEAGKPEFIATEQIGKEWFLSPPKTEPEQQL